MGVTQIPDKLYFKIGEVAHLAGVEPYVLRYWETEFQSIHPVKSRTNQRLYRRRDIETVLWIKQLLYDEGFTIDGARKRMKEVRGEKEEIVENQLPLTFDPSKDEKLLRQLRTGLEDILKSLEQ